MNTVEKKGWHFLSAKIAKLQHPTLPQGKRIKKSPVKQEPLIRFVQANGLVHIAPKSSELNAFALNTPQRDIDFVKEVKNYPTAG